MQGILLILGENGLQMQSCEKHRNQKDCFLCRQETKETDKRRSTMKKKFAGAVAAAVLAVVAQVQIGKTVEEYSSAVFFIKKLV